MMKKIFAILLSLVLCIGLFAGCTPPPATSNPPESGGTPPTDATNPPTQPVSITIWHSAEAAIADAMQAQVDALAPDIKVTFERKENMAEALKLVGNDPSSAPDMYFWAHDKVGVFAAMGILAPITDVLSESELQDFLPMTLTAGTYEGDMYQLPVYYEALLFMYNKALMDTPPATTDDLLAKMKAETTANQYVFVEQHSTSYNSAPWIQGFGGYIINADRQPGLDLPETLESLAYHREFIPYQPADGEYNTVTTLFSEGKAMSTIGGPWLVPGLKEANLDLGIAPMPILPNGQPLSPFSGVQGVHVLRHAAEEKRDAVAQVLRTLSQPETGIALAEAGSCAPANVKAYDDPTVSSNEMIMALKDVAQTAIPMPNIPEMDVMWGVVDGLLASVNKSGGDIATESEKYQKQALEQIEAMR